MSCAAYLSVSGDPSCTLTRDPGAKRSASSRWGHRTEVTGRLAWIVCMVWPGAKDRHAGLVQGTAGVGMVVSSRRDRGRSAADPVFSGGTVSGDAVAANPRPEACGLNS